MQEGVSLLVVELFVFEQHLGVESPLIGPHHNSCLPLPRIAVGFQTKHSADGGKQVDRPDVGH